MAGVTWGVTAIPKAPLKKPDSETAQEVIRQLPPPGSRGETTASQGAGTCQGHRPVGGSRGPRWPRGGGVPCCSPRSCVSTQRVQKVIFQAGAPGGWAGRGRSLEPSRKAGLAASRPPSPAARPSVGVALSRQPHGLGPGAAPPIAPWVTGGPAALWAGRNDSPPLPAPGGDRVGVRGAQRNEKG